MADAQDPDAAPKPYWAQPYEPIGPPMEQIPAEAPPQWGQQPQSGAPTPTWGPPAPGYAAEVGEKPANNLLWAVASLLFFWPLGIPAIYYATRVNGLWRSGDRAGADYAATRAKKFAIASMVLGVVVMVLVLAAGGPQA